MKNRLQRNVILWGDRLTVVRPIWDSALSCGIYPLPPTQIKGEAPGLLEILLLHRYESNVEIFILRLRGGVHADTDPLQTNGDLAYG